MHVLIVPSLTEGSELFICSKFLLLWLWTTWHFNIMNVKSFMKRIVLPRMWLVVVDRQVLCRYTIHAPNNLPAAYCPLALIADCQTNAGNKEPKAKAGEIENARFAKREPAIRDFRFATAHSCLDGFGAGCFVYSRGRRAQRRDPGDVSGDNTSRQT